MPKTLSGRKLRRKARRIHKAILPFFSRHPRMPRTSKAEKASIAREVTANTHFVKERVLKGISEHKWGVTLFGESSLINKKLRGKALVVTLAHEGMHLREDYRLLTILPQSISMYLYNVRQYRKAIPSNLWQGSEKKALIIKFGLLIDRISSGEIELSTEKQLIETPFGKIDSYAVGKYLGEYAGFIESQTGVRHSGLTFLGLLGEGKTFAQAERTATRLARMQRLKKSKKG